MALFRKFQRDEQLPVNQIISKRAAYCVQAWWSSLKIKKRLTSLANIRAHVAKINSPDLYLE